MLAALALCGCTAAPVPFAPPPSPASPVASEHIASPGPARTTVALPLFDAHVHFNRDARAAYTPDAAIAILRRAGVRRALVSSTPDEATFLLFDRAPDVVVPFLRPYRTRDDIASWTRDGTVVPYVESRYRKGVHRGLGEFHVSAEQASSAVVRALVALALREDLHLHVHGDARAVEALYALEPRAKVLWAHAGLTEGAGTVAAVLARYPSLLAELAIRSDVAPGGVLDPDWRDVFLRYSDRVLVGTDTWVKERWDAMPEILDAVRGWLRDLPDEAARRIAFENGERLFSKR